MLLNDYLRSIQEAYPFQKNPLVSERIMFSDKNMTYDIDLFLSGKSKKLFIMGLPGSGKTTLAHKLEKKFNAPVVHTDDCVNATIINVVGKDNIKNKSPEEIRDLVRNSGLTHSQFWMKCYDDCIKPKLLDNKKCIVEGIIYLWYTGFPKTRSLLIKPPCIMLGKSKIKSSIDRAVRDNVSLVKSLFKDLKNTKLYEMREYYIKDKKKYSKSVKEFSI